MPLDYNSTLNLPSKETDKIFPMRANLPAREPQMLEKWNREKIYETIQKHNEGKPLFVLHDGPPYANGTIHLGTALNKILKDFIIKYKSMTGYKAPYVPGYDTHGLPTELKARQKAGMKSDTKVSALELRKICREFALGFVEDQRLQFERLGVLGEWDNPYLTLKPEFVAKQIKVFGEMALKGYIYKGLKPVYWCPECQTALAEAEIEYSDDKCYSIYVKFKVKDDKGKLSAYGADLNKTYFVIWTTTTWTLPANVAICVGPDFEYSIVKNNDEYYVIAKELVESSMNAAGIEEYEVIGELSGSELEYMTTYHPFLDRESLVIVGDHVTLDSGTGCVHTAPGHGVEDYEVCKNYKDIPIIVPVDSKGRMTKEAGDFIDGLTTDEANKVIAKRLEETGNLFAIKKMEHQYPHCWRCKEPVLFRATEQWFCSVSDFVDDAVKAIEEVEWIPAWGEDRITAMVRDRSDWCISRQRTWGVPIPIFYCKDCGKEIITRETIDHVSDIFAKEGADAWYAKEAKDLLPDNFVCPHCGSSNFTKENDIMDVWFDSGVTHAAVCESRDYLKWPADMYLEGADQYRGWFQSSLLTAVATKGKAPYRTVVTHGWVVDGEGKKMSKSIGNVIVPEQVIKEYGADILRLWVASSDYHSDIRISKEILKQLSEVYRKIRNTARFILGNIFDFNPNTDMVPYENLEELDKWALYRLNNVIRRVKGFYDKYEFYNIFHTIHNFCVVDLSNFYLDIIKDRLYCEEKTGVKRRSAQTTMYIVLDTLTRLLAPILSFTAEEIWNAMPHVGEPLKSVFMTDMPNAEDKYDNIDVAKWEKIFNIREDVKKALENARNEKLIGAALESKIILHCKTDELYNFLKDKLKELSVIFICSETEAVKDNADIGHIGENCEGLSVEVIKATGEKCERCWIYSHTVGENQEHKTLCSRCAEVVSKI